LDNTVNRFDIVVFHSPDPPARTIIKRVIGLPDEDIEIRTGTIYINNRPLNQPFSSIPEDGLNPLPHLKPVRIPPDHYFVVGDHRGLSRDSRFFGMIHRDRITGRVFFRYWPPARLGGVS
jgi:signal peptidase I